MLHHQLHFWGAYILSQVLTLFMDLRKPIFCFRQSLQWRASHSIKLIFLCCFEI